MVTIISTTEDTEIGIFSFFRYTICIGCPPLADGVIQLKKKPTEEIRKHFHFFSLICRVYSR